MCLLYFFCLAKYDEYVSPLIDLPKKVNIFIMVLKINL